MEQMWQVCELEDSRQRFTVAGVPETWAIKLPDGSLVCYWPKYNPGLKIRTRQLPNFEEKYTFYKCRILMDGEKFATYQKARDAEKDAENFSSIKDRSVITETSKISNTVQDVCDSTMNFDVADVDENENFDLNGTNGTINFDVSDVGTNTDEIVGNDSYEFNKAVLKGDGYHARELAISEVEDDEERVRNLLKVADYRAFKSAGNFFTSTFYDELEATHDTSELKLYDDAITSKKSKIEKKVCLFVEDIKKDLIDVKEMAISAKRLKMRHDSDKTNENSPVRKNSSLLSNDIHESNQKSQSLNENDSVPGIHILNVEILNLPVPSTEDVTSSSVIIPSTQNDSVNFNDTFVTKPAKNIVSNVHEETWNVQESSLCEVMPKTLNDTFVTKSEKHDDLKVVPLDVSNEETLNVRESLLREVIVKTLNPDPNKTFVGERATVILLPNKDVDHYKRNEELLDETALEEALTKHLTPFDQEDEITYLNRAISMLFDDNFLLKHVSWKNGKNHVNIKNSYLMGCWNAGHQTKFLPDVDNRKFKLQIRRVKQAKRALLKKELKREQKKLKLSALIFRN